MKVTASLLAVALALGQADANLGWLGAGLFPSPQTCDNTCSPQQHSGFSFGGLATGSFGAFGGLNFGGFSCAPSFSAGIGASASAGSGGIGASIGGALGIHLKNKRRAAAEKIAAEMSPLKRNLFGGQCILGSLSNSLSNCPSISSDSGKAFSVTSFNLQTEFDTNVECHYTMPNNQPPCVVTQPCSAGGSVVQNNQCGGATQVQFKLPDTASKPCSLGINSIQFDCNGRATQTSVSAPPSSPVAPPPPPPPPTTTTTPIAAPTTTTSSTTSDTTPTPAASSTTSTTTSGPTPAASSTTSTTTSSPTSAGGSTTSSTTSTTSTPSSAAPSSTSSTSTSTTTTGPVSPPSTTSTIFSTSVSTIISCGPTVLNCPAGSTILTTSIIAVSTTVCPVTATQTTPTTTVTPSSAAPSSAAPQSTLTTTTGQPAPVVSASCPQILPKCLNTWLHMTPCQNNADTSCFCPIANFTNNVVGCVQAWGNQNDVQAGLSTFAGLCAQHVSNNPAIVTAIPTTVTLSPAPSAAAGPLTTIYYTNTVTVPCSTAGSAIASSSTVTVYSSQVTVPQVQLITQTPAGPSASTSVVLAPGTTAPAAAAPAATNAGSAAAPVATVSPAGSTPVVGNTTGSTSPPQVSVSLAGRADVTSLFSILAAGALALVLV